MRPERYRSPGGQEPAGASDGAAEGAAGPGLDGAAGDPAAEPHPATTIATIAAIASARAMGPTFHASFGSGLDALHPPYARRRPRGCVVRPIRLSG
jgi:hypothetical protein